MSDEEMQRVVAQHFAEKLGKLANHLRVDFEGGGFYDVPLSTTLAIRQHHVEIDSVDGVDQDLFDAIKGVLMDTCKRHTREEMVAALSRTTFEYSESAVQKALWKMKKGGALSNRKDNSGTGFGMLDWT